MAAPLVSRIGGKPGSSPARLLILAVGIGMLSRAAFAQAPPTPPPTGDTRLDRSISLEVRAATVSSLVDRLANSLDIPMEVDREIAGERVTLYAPGTKVVALQDAIGALHQSGWTSTGEGDETRYRLRANLNLLSRAQALRNQRRSQLVARALETEQQVAQRGPQAVAEEMRAAVAKRRPELPQASLDQITGDYVNQSLLLTPLRSGLTSSLLRGDLAWLPLTRLTPAQQRVMTAFYLGRGAEPAIQAVEDRTEPLPPPQAGLDPAALSWPRARLEYRLLYGDRWSGDLLLTRVGTSDSWANSMLASALYPLPDYATLYPEASLRPTETALYRPVDVKIDPTLQSWDQALSALSKGAKINVISDVYLRPDVFRPSEPRRIIQAANLIQLLDKVADYYGYVWWKQGDWFIFRHRMWGEERRVAVPDRVLQTMGTSLAESQTLSSQALTSLAALSDEQLLTLHLYGSAAGQADAPLRAFDYEEVALVHSGLMLVSQMTDSQRALARGRGLPFMLMTPVQQFIFSSLAYDRGIEPDPYSQEEWSFRLSDQFDRRRVGAGWAEVGQITLEFNCGENGTRVARLAARAPALERPQRKEERPE